MRTLGKKLAWVILSRVAEEEGPEAQEDPAGLLRSTHQYPGVLEEDRAINSRKYLLHQKELRGSPPKNPKNSIITATSKTTKIITILN